MSLSLLPAGALTLASLLACVFDGCEGVECAGVADEGQVAGHNGNKQLFGVAHREVGGGVRFRLRAATTLRRDVAERGQLALPQRSAAGSMARYSSMPWQPKSVASHPR